MGRNHGMSSNVSDTRLLQMLIHNLNSQASYPELPPSSVDTASGWLVDVMSGNKLWVHPRELQHIVIIPARSCIPIVPGMDTDGQQHTYILLLRGKYSNSWADLTKVFNRIWNGPSTTVNKELGVKTEHEGEYPQISQIKLEAIWAEQTRYARDEEGTRGALAILMAREDIFVKTSNDAGDIRFENRKALELTDFIAQCAKEVKVELVEV